MKVILLKIFDRIAFHLFYKHYYKAKFKVYGNNIRWGRDFHRLTIPSSIRVSCPELIEIHDNVQIDDEVYLQCHGQGQGISINKGSRINKGTHIQAFSKITIEENVLIAPSCNINTGTHGFTDKSLPIMEQEYIPAGETKIGKGSWLAHSCHVLGGVVIGKNNVVAAGAVVTKSSRDYVILAGVPAKEIKEI